MRYPTGEYAFPGRFEGVDGEVAHGLPLAVLFVSQQPKIPCSGDDRPAAATDIELLPDVLNARLDRLFADAKLLGNIRVAQVAVGKEFQDARFAARQSRPELPEGGVCVGMA